MKLYLRYDMQDESDKHEETLDQMKAWLVDFWNWNPNEEWSDAEHNRHILNIQKANEEELVNYMGGIDYTFEEVHKYTCQTCAAKLKTWHVEVGEWNEYYCGVKCALEWYTIDEVADMASKRLYSFQVSKAGFHVIKRQAARRHADELYRRVMTAIGAYDADPTPANLANLNKLFEKAARL